MILLPTVSSSFPPTAVFEWCARVGRLRIASVWCRMSCREVRGVAGHFDFIAQWHFWTAGLQFELFCGSLDGVI